MKRLLLMLLLMLFFLPFGKAAIVINEPSPVYNLGDSLEISMSILELSKTDGLLKASLECNNSFLFYVTPLSMEANIEKKINVPALQFSREMLGACYVLARIESFDGTAVDSARTKSFSVSDVINIAIELNKKNFLPSEKLEIRANATKANSKAADGVASIAFVENYSAILKNGFFSLSVVLPERIKGMQEIFVSVEDASGNKGFSRESINIKAVPKRILLQLNNKTFLPNEKLLAEVTLYDQVDDEIEENSSVSLSNPEGKEIAIRIIKAGDRFEHVFASDAKPGEWLLFVYSEGIEEKASVSMKEHASISVSIEESMLIIKNTGNVAYNKPVEITFEREGSRISIIKNSNLSIGEEKKFELSAPQGNYNVTISSEDIKKVFKSLPLTGNVVDVIEKKLDIGKGELRKLLVLAFILAIIAFIAYIKMRR